MGDLIDFAYMKANYNYLDVNETKVGVIISAVSQQVIKMTDNNFESVEYVEYQDGDRKSYLILKAVPIISIENLWISSAREYDSDSLIDSDDYRFEPFGLIKLYENFLPVGYDTVKIEYTAGYAAVPDDVQMAVADAVDWNYKQRNNQATGIEAQTFPDGITTTFQTQIPFETIRVLMRYRVLSP